MKQWGAINEEDEEDFEQEKLIKEWLEREGRDGEIELKHISRKGTARNTLVKASISLDEKMSDDDSKGTFADLIAGCDGRDLDDGEPDDPFEREIEELEWCVWAVINLAKSQETKLWARELYQQWCEQQKSN